MFCFLVVLSVGESAILTEIPSNGIYFGSFGFDSDSYLEADGRGLFIENSTNFVSIQLLTTTEYISYVNKKENDEVSCHDQFLFGDFELRVSAAHEKVRLPVNVSRVYRLVAFGCNSTFYSSFGIKIILKNSFGYLDTRAYPAMTSVLVVAGIALVVAIFWACLVFWQRSQIKRMHLIIAFMAFAPALDHFLMHFYLSELNQKNRTDTLGVLWFMARIANYTVMGTALLFATLGLSIFCDDLSQPQKIQSFLCSFLLVITLEWFFYWSGGQGNIFTLLLAFLGIGLYTRELVRNISNGSAVVLAALVGTEGNATNSSFVYKQVQYLLIGIGMIIIFNLGLSALGDFLSQWMKWTLEGVSQIAVVLGFCVVYRIILPGRGSYQDIDDNSVSRDRRDDSEVLLADLDSHDIEDINEVGNMRTQPLLGNSDRLPRLVPSSLRR